jgi:hypothetical protein
MAEREFVTKKGIVLQLQEVDQVIAAKLTLPIEKREPTPPIEIVPAATGTKEFANENNHEYLEALKIYRAEYILFMVGLGIELGVDIELDEEKLKAARKVQTKRETYNPGAPENKFLTYMYVVSLCPTIEEQTNLSLAIGALNTPTEEQVQQHLNQFRPGVSGPSGDENQDTQEQNLLPFGVATVR